MDVTDLRFSEEPLLAENKSPRSEDPMVVYEEMTQDDEIEAAVMICLDNLNGPIDCCALEPDGLEDAVARRFG